MKREAVLHIPMSEYASGIDESRVVIRLRTAKSDLKTVTLFYGDKACRQNPVLFTPVAMVATHSDNLFDWWEAEFETLYRRMCYYFELFDGISTVLYYSDLFSKELTPERSELFQLPYLHRADIARAPDWAHDAIIYNIFPDSFATSSEYISLKPTKKTWNGETVCGKLGGTIRGITENATYIQNLGANCVYINPLFVAGAYHKYDLIDYYNVDPCFGTNEDFAEMVKTFHSKGMRVIIDGVFNHCGWRFFAFNDVVKNGAASPYADWFYRLEYPVTRPDNGDDIPGYECFAYERLMPKLNMANPETQAYFCDVAKHWLREYDIDGWRLDVADEVNDAFWRAFKNAALSVKQDALLIGEVWPTASHWLDGSMFHSCMNYDFRKHARAFFALSEIGAEEFAARVTYMLMRYRRNLAYVQLNLLDSHDVSRFLSLCGGDKRRLKLAVIFQMCFVGIPSIFYGDEQGFDGLTEEEYRQPMRWGCDDDMLSFYKQAIQLRRNNPALCRGDFKTLTTDGNLYAFRREYGKNTVTVALNAGDSPARFAGCEVEPLGYLIV